MDVLSSIELPGITLNTLAEGNFDAAGLRWTGELLGWRDAGVPRTKTWESGGGIGDRYFGGDRGTKPMTLQGMVQANSQAALNSAEARLQAALDMLRPARTIRVNESPAKQIEVFANGAPARFRQTGRYWAEIGAGLVAPDPRRFSVARQQVVWTANGTKRVRGLGNAPAFPVWVISGASTNFTAVKDGRSVTVGQTTIAGDVLVVDFDRARAWKNGVDVSSTVSLPPRWEVDGGDNLLSRQESSLEETSLTSSFGTLNATLARLEALADDGSYCLAITAIGATPTFTTLGSLAGVPVVAGTTYSAAISLRALATLRSPSMMIRWYNAAGADLSDSTVVVPEVAGQWARGTLSAVAPVNAAFASVGAVLTSAAVGEMHLADRLSLVSGAVPRFVPGGSNVIAVTGLTGGTAALEFPDAWW